MPGATCRQSPHITSTVRVVPAVWLPTNVTLKPADVSAAHSGARYPPDAASHVASQLLPGEATEPQPRVMLSPRGSNVKAPALETRSRADNNAGTAAAVAGRPALLNILNYFKSK
jgi:hypothetical protein